MNLVKVTCPAIRMVPGAMRICHRVIDEVPPDWRPEVTVLEAGRHGIGPNARLDRCPQCGSWLSVRYAGLRAAS